MAEHIGIEDARKNLGPLVSRVQYSGAEIILTRNGKPAAMLVPIPQEPAMTRTITTATQWADALDDAMDSADLTAGDFISFGYANGQLAGVTLNPEHPDADDERGVIVSDTGWIVGYDAQSGYWRAR